VRIPLPILVSLLLALAVSAARADVRWSADFANGDLKQWGVIQCGGQGSTCPAWHRSTIRRIRSNLEWRGLRPSR